MKKKIIVTTSWDDGHILDLKVAELLSKYKLKGTFYVSPFNHEFERKYLLSNSDILMLSKKFEIGAHTMTHVNLKIVSFIDAQKEISNSKKYLEKVIKKPVASFCYPYGAYNAQTLQLVRNSKFKLARTTNRVLNTKKQNQFELSTTVHAYTHLKDLFNLPLLLDYKTISWERIAKLEFDRILENGGVFHLWGHSWEVEKFRNWEKLENIFRYISHRSDINYVDNANSINL